MIRHLNTIHYIYYGTTNTYSYRTEHLDIPRDDLILSVASELIYVNS